MNKQSITKRRTAVWLAACLLFSACGEDPAEQAPSPPQVRTAPLSELQIHLDYSAPAQALSVNDSVLAAELSTTVERVVTDVGMQAEAGGALIDLDCRDAKDTLDQAEASLQSLNARAALAEQQFERARALRQSRNVSEEELNRRETELDAARADRRAQAAQLELARRNVKRCTVTAPFDGVVTERHVESGERVSPGTPLVRLVDTGRLEVRAQVAADQADQLVSGSQPVFVAGDRRYPLKIRNVAAAVDSQTLTQAARLDFTGTHPKPGTLGSLVWTDPRPALPAHLISQRDDQLGVLLARDGKAVFHALPDALSGRSVIVDLPADAPVITDGRRGLAAGDEFIVGDSP